MHLLKTFANFVNKWINIFGNKVYESMTTLLYYVYQFELFCISRKMAGN